MSGSLSLSMDARWAGAASRDRRRQTPRQVLSILLLTLIVATGTFVTRSAVAGSGPDHRVIIRTLPGHEQAVGREVVSLGGRVEVQLPIIHGFAATVPEVALQALTHDRAVQSVTPNGRLSLTGRPDPSDGMYSMLNVAKSVRATKLWDAGYTGKGVDVALIDSGVARVEGLKTPGKVINGPDLSFESQAPNLRYLDTYGHGTNMAGIIAGRDTGANPSEYEQQSTDFMGIAPDARLVSVKVADSHGNADVSQVIAAIDWVVQHAHDPGLNIEVLNLSFGTASNQSYLLDPLAFAAEVAWHRGITVVAAAGNAGRSATWLANPAFDPYLLAVGAVDHMGSSRYSQWKVADYSQTGDGIRNPDILAPGSHIESLRVPGSYLDGRYPGAVVADRFFRGSGSSQATAVVAGALALLFQQHPSLTPDQAKALLTKGSNALRPSEGFGRRHGQRALRLDTAMSASVPLGMQAFPRSTGSGTLEASRGPGHLVRYGIPLQGEKDIFGSSFDAAKIAALEAAGNSWTGGRWNGNEWSGNEWTGNEWSGLSWSGNGWTGNDWAGNEWAGNEWAGNEWAGNEWTGNEWTGNEWTGNEWAGNEWAGNEWSSGAWSSASWS
jgi:subtilase family protein